MRNTQMSLSLDMETSRVTGQDAGEKVLLLAPVKSLELTYSPILSTRRVHGENTK